MPLKKKNSRYRGLYCLIPAKKTKMLFLLTCSSPPVMHQPTFSFYKADFFLKYFKSYLLNRINLKNMYLYIGKTWFFCSRKMSRTPDFTGKIDIPCMNNACSSI